MTDRYLSPAQVCDLLPGLTVEILLALRKQRRGPRYFKPTGERGKVILYREEDVRAWVDAAAISTRDQP